MSASSYADGSGVVVFAEPRAPTQAQARQAPTPSSLYDTPLLLIALSILFLSTLDAMFTLVLLDTGLVREWNPLMAYLLERDVQLFANVKTALTAGGVVLLVRFSRERFLGVVPVRSMLTTILGLYLALISYHLLLLFRTGIL